MANQPHEIWIAAEPRHSHAAIALYITGRSYVNTRDEQYYRAVLTWEPVPRDEYDAPATLYVPRERGVPERLLDDLWRMGVKLPGNGNVIDVLKAKDDHAADQRETTRALFALLDKAINREG